MIVRRGDRADWAQAGTDPARHGPLRSYVMRRCARSGRGPAPFGNRGCRWRFRWADRGATGVVTAVVDCGADTTFPG